ncbi:MAG: hypothetical protein KC486_31260 [Myxococcales bacterium]|nr:hypothetical protein [Myxococcales bacterium]
MAQTSPTNYVRDSRGARPLLEARLRKETDGRLALLAPAVGRWRDRPPAGALIRPGSLLGRLEVLGLHYALVAPDGAHGVVVAEALRDAPASARLARRPVAYDDVLLLLDRDIAPGVVADAGADDDAGTGDGLVVRAPSSGRFYRRPAPDKPPFVAVGDVIDEGKVIGLLEVMKTFTRIAYGGGDLPKRAKVTALHAADEADVAAGEALIGVEPAE